MSEISLADLSLHEGVINYLESLNYTSIEKARDSHAAQTTLKDISLYEEVLTLDHYRFYLKRNMHNLLIRSVSAQKILVVEERFRTLKSIYDETILKDKSGVLIIIDTSERIVYATESKIIYLDSVTGVIQVSDLFENSDLLVKSFTYISKDISTDIFLEYLVNTHKIESIEGIDDAII